ncbi:MAG: chemotaxis protein CheW [Caulobacter sp.]
MAQALTALLAGGDERQVISFEVAGQEFCLDVGSVRELRGFTEPTPMPDSPPYVTGVINLRGTVMPVIDLRARLGFAGLDAAARPVIVVIESGDDCAGLMVDAVCDTYTVAPDDVTPPPGFSEYSGDGLVSAVIKAGDKMIILLSADTLLPQGLAAAA